MLVPYAVSFNEFHLGSAMKAIGSIWKSVIAVLIIAWLASGCAATRSVIDVKVENSEANLAKAYVKVIEVTDKRRFEARPSDPSVPSLQKAAETQNPAITARAIARKRGGFGNALADILLPEGRTVSQVVREAVTSALNDKGYAVVEEGSANFGNASPMQVDIEQFWSWFTPGMWLISLEFESKLLMQGSMLAGEKDVAIRGYNKLDSAAATDGRWQQVMQAGIQDLVEKIKEKLKSAE